MYIKSISVTKSYNSHDFTCFNLYRGREIQHLVCPLLSDTSLRHRDTICDSLNNWSMIGTDPIGLLATCCLGYDISLAI